MRLSPILSEREWRIIVGPRAVTVSQIDDLPDPASRSPRIMNTRRLRWRGNAVLAEEVFPLSPPKCYSGNGLTKKFF